MASKNSWVPSRQLIRSWKQSQKSCRVLGPPQAPPALLPNPSHQAQHPFLEWLLLTGQDEPHQSRLKERLSQLVTDGVGPPRPTTGVKRN